jgi:hypothetical protein
MDLSFDESYRGWGYGFGTEDIFDRLSRFVVLWMGHS